MIEGEPVGLYYDEFHMGDRFVTPARTITQTDIVNFSAISGDYNYPHSNYEACKESGFGDLVAHGPLVYAVTSGLFYASGVTRGTVVAMLGGDNWRMCAPVFAGDTIQAVHTVLEMRPVSDGKRGIVLFKREIFNQREVVVQELELRLMFWRARPKDAAHG